MKNLFITCILVGAFVPLFQNCGQKSYGNGDPYETSDGRVDISPVTEEVPDPASNIGILSRECTGTGNVRRANFSDLNTGKELITMVTKDGKSRSVTRAHSVDMSLVLNVNFNSGIIIKSLNIFPNSVTIGVEISGVISYEQLTCVVY